MKVIFIFAGVCCCFTTLTLCQSPKHVKENQKICSFLYINRLWARYRTGKVIKCFVWWHWSLQYNLTLLSLVIFISIIKNCMLLFNIKAFFYLLSIKIRSIIWGRDTQFNRFIEVVKRFGDFEWQGPYDKRFDKLFIRKREKYSM